MHYGVRGLAWHPERQTSAAFADARSESVLESGRPDQVRRLPADMRSSQACWTRAAMFASPALPQERGS
jgi:hypothetical protein